MRDYLIILMCGLYVVLEAFVAFLGKRFGFLKGEGNRKFIHMATSLLIFPVVYMIENPLLRLVGPSVFIVFNFVASHMGMGRIIGLDDDKRHMGLVVYPFSVLILVILVNGGYIASSSAVTGVLIMGLGDGSAALIGKKWGKHGYRVSGGGKKSLEGTLSMALVSCLVAITFSPLGIWGSLLVALLSSGVENISPSGIDNATVPLFAALLTEVLCRL